MREMVIVGFFLVDSGASTVVNVHLTKVRTGQIASHSRTRGTFGGTLSTRSVNVLLVATKITRLYPRAMGGLGRNGEPLLIAVPSNSKGNEGHSSVARCVHSTVNVGVWEAIE